MTVAQASSVAKSFVERASSLLHVFLFLLGRLARDGSLSLALALGFLLSASVVRCEVLSIATYCNVKAFGGAKSTELLHYLEKFSDTDRF